MLEFVLLGLIQGIVEWIPISSQGQLVLFAYAFMDMPLYRVLDAAVWLHTGTFFAALIYLRVEVLRLLRRLPSLDLGGKTVDDALIVFLFVSVLVTGAVGLPLYLWVREGFALFSGEFLIAFVGILLVMTGLVQRFAGRKRVGARSVKKPSGVDALFLGVLQGLSVLPGVSRSGMTVSGLIFRGFDSVTALRVSFLMSILAVAGAEVGLALMGRVELSAPMLVAALSAFFFGYISMGALLRLAERIRFWLFCVFLGFLSLLPLLLWA